MDESGHDYAGVVQLGLPAEVPGTPLIALLATDTDLWQHPVRITLELAPTPGLRALLLRARAVIAVARGDDAVAVAAVRDARGVYAPRPHRPERGAAADRVAADDCLAPARGAWCGSAMPPGRAVARGLGFVDGSAAGRFRQSLLRHPTVRSRPVRPVFRRVSRFLRLVGQRFFVACGSSWSGGWLIHAALGRAAGSGCLRTNRSGLRV